MKSVVIRRVGARDARFLLKPGEGMDAIHATTEYAYAVAVLETGGPMTGTGLALTLGDGTELVCAAIELLGAPLLGREIEELMAEFGKVFRQIADHPQLRWLGPHKGVVHLALAVVLAEAVAAHTAPAAAKATRITVRERGYRRRRSVTSWLPPCGLSSVEA